MSQNTKQYINGVWINEKEFDDGGSILKLSILPEKFLESFKKAQKNSDGFIKLVIAKSKNPQENSSHYIYVDDWQPKTQTSRAAITPKSKPAYQKSRAVQEEESDPLV